MKIEIIKHTGEMETVQVEQTKEDGTKETVDQEREILEVIQDREFLEDEKDQVMKAAALRCAMLSRDTGFRHAVRLA